MDQKRTREEKSLKRKEVNLSEFRRRTDKRGEGKEKRTERRKRKEKGEERETGRKRIKKKTRFKKEKHFGMNNS